MKMFEAVKFLNVLESLDFTVLSDTFSQKMLFSFNGILKNKNFLQQSFQN